MTQPLEIITLGGLTIQRNQVVVTGFVSRKVEALLVYLACEPREHPREFLANLLWDDVPQARAMANLRMALSSLQQQLEDYVVVTRQTIAINPYSPIKIDIRELTTTLDKAELTWARAGRLPRSLIHDLDEALSLYHGDFLAGFHLRDSRGFDDWRLLEQERLRANMIAILNRLAEQFLEQRTYAEGLDYASRLLQLDPLREETHRLMMQLQVGLGERSAAIAQYKTCERLLQQELGVEPSAETIHLYQQIVQGVVETTAPAQPPKHNLPFPSTPFIERPAEQMQIAERLDRTDCRLLSLVGPGGTGKTRLALHAALERVEDYHDGVYLVTFNPVDSPAYLLPPIAAALKLKTGDNPIEDLLDYLRDKRMLLILDNSEYVLEGASVLDEILNHTQWLKIIAISRERLQLQQEWVLPIGGLECPPAGTVTDPEQYGAVQLFAYSARRVQAHFSLDQDFEGVRRVCALVEGMPLGLELASAWTSVMSVAQIATQIEQSLGFLETALRNVPQRHRSIRALFEHSWTMLNEAERDTLTRLSVFQNKFDLQSAEAVAESTPAIMLSLVEKSLVRSSVKDSYDLHSLLRRYAGEKLQESGEASATFEKHARFFTQRVEADAAANQEERTIEYYEDARAALEWLASTRNTMLLRLSSALDGFWQRSGYLAKAVSG
ncbi:MAG: transcriptional activator domain-containing protein [Chloroflexi bacterium OLB15]|nr:MAG: transcriptional activator domain-containing protein [Chloroflexi bacterium OLB15]